MSRTHLNAVRIRTEERGYIALYNAEQESHSILASSNASFTSSNWVLQIIASIFLLLYLYFVYNVIFLPSKKLILCCYPCLVMLFMIKNLARKRNKPLQCVGLR